MTEKDLLNAGYRRWPNTPSRNASHFYQRAVMEDDKKAYFLNVYVYPISGIGRGPGVSLEAEAQLYLSDDRWLTLEFHNVEKQTLEQMEAIFFETYVKLGCIPDVHNND